MITIEEAREKTEKMLESDQFALNKEIKCKWKIDDTPTITKKHVGFYFYPDIPGEVNMWPPEIIWDLEKGTYVYDRMGTSKESEKLVDEYAEENGIPELDASVYTVE